LRTLALLLTPYTPHLSEEIGEMLGEQGFISVAKWPAFDADAIDERAQADQEYVDEIITTARRHIQAKNLEPTAITLYLAEAWKHEFVPKFRALFASVKNPKEIAEKLVKDPKLAAHAADAQQLAFAVFKNQKLLPIIDRTHEEEQLLLASSIDAIAKALGFEANIGSSADNDPKAKSGLPGKPAVSFR
jgi:leucyl-tRNA synthetase